jgi:hypothetical protein
MPVEAEAKFQFFNHKVRQRFIVGRKLVAEPGAGPNLGDAVWALSLLCSGQLGDESSLPLSQPLAEDGVDLFPGCLAR